jgi:hypothetical protein
VLNRGAKEGAKCAKGGAERGAREGAESGAREGAESVLTCKEIG